MRTLDIPAEVANYFAELPEHLQPHAFAMFNRVVKDTDAWELSRAEIASALTSASFRPILEQEARLSGMGLAS